MKTQIKKLLFVIIAIGMILGITTIVVNASNKDGFSNISDLRGTNQNSIGKTFELKYDDLYKGTDLYCIQRWSEFMMPNEKLDPIKYSVKTYVEIDGKQTTVVDSGNTSKYTNDASAKIAYILNKREGYSEKGDGLDGRVTTAQRALWRQFNSWANDIGLSKYYAEGNKYTNGEHAKEHTTKWSDSIEEQIAELMKEVNSYVDNLGKTPGSLSVNGVTNKSNLTIVSVDGYDRIGPFNWNFEGTIEDIIATGDSGTIASSNIRFVKYAGNTANVVNKSNIKTGETFYVDIKQSANVKTFKSLKIKTKSTTGGETIYTAKMWFLESGSHQRLMYADVGSRTTTVTGEGSEDYNLSLTDKINLYKVDDRDESKPLQKIGFKFKTKVYRNGKWEIRYLGSDLRWSATDIGSAKECFVDEKGEIHLEITGETRNGSIIAVETTNQNYGYEGNVGKEYTVGDDTKKFTNHQYKVKLSGYVWIDTHNGKTTTRDDEYKQSEDNNGNGFNGITVYLRDKNGNEIKKTSTAELGLYSEINGGEYQFVDVDLDKLQNGEYYVEFEYCGIKYQSVAAKLTQSNGSKAIDTATRNVLDSKFTSVDGNGTQTLNINNVTVNYNNTTDHVSSIKDCSGCNVYARTNEAGYNLYSGFTPTAEEIRNVNLGLYEKQQADYALTQDLYNVRISVNGFSHIYRYGSVRYDNSGNDVNEDSSWNVGVKFQNNRGTYNRAIYKSDAEYEAANHKDNELKVYLTYKIALKNESTYLGKINNIVNYSDNDYEMIAAGTAIDDNDTISSNLNYGSKTTYNDEYSKYTIDVNTLLGAGETKYIYVQFQMNREAVLKIVNNGELLNNVAEINSYVTYKDNNQQTPVAVVDVDSVPGNATPGNISSYEDDTEAAPIVQLKETDSVRTLNGTVFVDSATGELGTGKIRQGDGRYGTGDIPLKGIQVELIDLDRNQTGYIYSDSGLQEAKTTTDDQGNYYFNGLVAGNYVVRFTWGDSTYKVQYYKGTIYEKDGREDDVYWYRRVDNTRRTDAIDNYAIRQEIDNETANVTDNTLATRIENAYNGHDDKITKTKMQSNTPTMAFGVEFNDNNYNNIVISNGVDNQKITETFKIENVDFGIVERARQQMDISKRVKYFKITLSNGQVLAEANIDANGKVNGELNYVTYQPSSINNGIKSNGFIKAEVDKEIIENANLLIKYEIVVTNNSEKDYYTYDYYAYGTIPGEDKVITLRPSTIIEYSDSEMILNNNNSWNLTNTTEIRNLNAHYATDSEFLKGRTLYANKGMKEFKPTESQTIEIEASKLLTSTDDYTFDNDVEIATINKPVTDQQKGSVAKFSINGVAVDAAEKAIIIPPTGDNESYTQIVIISVISLAILSTGIVLIKKFVIG